MANDIQLKRSSVAGRVPDAANVLVGEPVINLADKILYTKNGSGQVIVIGAGTTSNVTEGTNLYYTNARVYSNVTQLGYITSSALSGYATNSQLTSYATTANLALKANIADLTTSNVIEGGNLYFTTARVATALTNQTLTNATFSGNVTVGNLISTGSLTANGSIISGGLSGFFVDTVAAGTTSNVIYYNVSTKELTYGTISSGVTSVAGATGAVSNAQLASGITSSGLLTTANVTEVTNLYFTNARARTAISVTGAATYDNATGVINVTGGVTSVAGATGAVSNAQLASGITTTGVLNTSNVTEGANLYFTNARAVAAFTEGSGINIDANGLITSTVTAASSNSFATIQVSGQSNVVASSSTDTLTLEAAGLLDLTTDAGSKKVTIGSTNKVFPFYNSSGSYAAVQLRVSDTILNQTLNNVYLPFTKTDGSQVTTLRIQ